MRTPLLKAAVLGFSLLAACDVGDPGNPHTGGGDDVGTGDDGGGDDSGSNTPTPMLSVTVDKPTISTELKSTNQVMVTLTSTGGFAESVTLAPSVVDAGGATVPGWNATLDSTTVAVPANGTATAVATLTIPSDAAMLTGKLKIDVTSTALGMKTASSDVTAANQLTFTVDVDNGGACVYPTDGGGSGTAVNVKMGTKVRFYNKSATQTIIIHSNNTAAIPHEGQGAAQNEPSTGPLTAYEKTMAVSTGGPFTWYCHAPGPDNGNANPTIKPVP